MTQDELNEGLKISKLILSAKENLSAFNRLNNNNANISFWLSLNTADGVNLDINGVDELIIEGIMKGFPGRMAAYISDLEKQLSEL